MVSATNLTMAYGGKILFEHTNLQLNAGQHYGLVGANGAGKSTLIKILSGEMGADGGTVTVPAGMLLGSLKQNHFLYENCVISDVVLQGDAVLWEALQKKELLLQHQSHFTEEECQSLAEIDRVIERHGGYSAASRAGQLLQGLGIKHKQQSLPLSTLSGGYKLRVLLAQLLFSRPDILVLDEPTNHLDLFSIRWLQGYLAAFPGTLLVSSHDRCFLNAFAQHILDVDQQTLRCWPGNYDAFEEGKASENERISKVLEKQGKKCDHMQEFVDRFGAKATKARQAQSRARMVEKIRDDMDALRVLPTSRRFPNIRFEQVRAAAATVLRVEQINKSYGDKQVLHGISFAVERGQKVAIVGANGIGKSTLLEIITGNVAQDSGTFAWGFASFCSYFPQDHSREVSGNFSLLDWLRQWDKGATEQQLRELLGRQLFCGDDVKKKIETLSGGERARLILAKMMLLKHNILLFDEPTNHLDMEATEQLLKALAAYPGTILFVSHNAHFIERLATRVIEMSEEGVKDYLCGYEEYLRRREEAEKLMAGAGKVKEVAGDKELQRERYGEQKQRQRKKEQLQRKIAQQEERCTALEGKLAAIDEAMAAAGFDSAGAREGQAKLIAEKNACVEALESAFHTWELLHNELQDIC